MSYLENQVKYSVARGDQNPIGLFSTVVEISSDENLLHGEFALVDASEGDINVTLPQPLNSSVVTVKKIDNTGNAVNVLTPNSETIDGQSSLSITSQYTSREMASDGDNYYIK